MESNRDESIKCIRVCKEYLSKGDIQKAFKFAKKSQALYPSNEAQELIEAIRKKIEASEDKDSTMNGDGLRHRQTNSDLNGAAKTNESSSPENTYTKDQLEAVNRIRRCKNYYEILGIPKDASESELKKSYRKLALEFHPDKNHAPGATEAFKAIGNAFAVLNDPEKKRKYDLYGEEEARQPRRNHHGHYDYSHGFEAEVTPEELFNMFFGNTVFTTHATRSTRSTRHSHSRRHYQQTESNLNLLFQLSPIIMMVLLSLLSFALQGDDPYSFSRTTKYKIERKTHNLNVHYFVKEDFTKHYYGISLNKLEREIESVYISHLRNECYKEQMQRQNVLWRAKYRNDGRAYDEAMKIQLKSCERLQAMYDS